MRTKCQDCPEYLKKRWFRKAPVCRLGRKPETCICIECSRWDTHEERCTEGKKPSDCSYPARPWYSPTLWMFAMMDKPILNSFIPRQAKEEYRCRKDNGDLPTLLDLVTGVQDRLNDFKDGV